MSKIQPNNWQKGLNLITHCPICENGYSNDTVKKFIHRDSVHLAHIACNSCSSYFLAMIMEMGRGISTIGMVTDLNFEDVSRLYGVDTIGIDEIINAYSFIESDNFYKELKINKKICRNIN